MHAGCAIFHCDERWSFLSLSISCVTGLSSAFATCAREKHIPMAQRKGGLNGGDLQTYSHACAFK